MKAFLYILVLLYRFVFVFSISCTANPSQLQCLAANNRFLLPRKSACDPFKNDCRMGDLINSTIAGLFLLFIFLLFDNFIPPFKLRLLVCFCLLHFTMFAIFFAWIMVKVEGQVRNVNKRFVYILNCEICQKRY